MRFATLDDLGDARGRRALVRVDLNVPMDGDRVTDATRIERAAATIAELAAAGAKVILLSHFGRPKGKVVPEMSLRPVAAAMGAILGRPVGFAGDCIGETARAAIAAMQPGDVLVLENTRFHAGEEANDPGFADALAELGDFYVNDGFSVSHRAHASTEGVARRLPAFAGRAMEEELRALEAGLGDPRRPLAAIVGGAKVSTKIDLLENLVGKVDLLMIGGGMANTFLLAKGFGIGKSLCEPDLADTARRILDKAGETGCRILLPQDAVVAREFRAHAGHRTVAIGEVPDDSMILDAGPQSVAQFCAAIDEARTLVWNGPFGAFELPPFDAATVAVARHVAERTRLGELISVAGGGDTVAALNHAGVADRLTYVSTAGGAFLEWMEGRVLPGVAVLAGESARES